MQKPHLKLRANSLGILAALFFSLTFVLNEVNINNTGYWLWTATLRYLWMLPMLYGLMFIPQLHASRQRVKQAIKSAPIAWGLWSQVCFVLFYVPLCWASQYLPGWLVSSVWQLTIIFGVLTTPLMKVKMADGQLQRLKIPRNKILWMVLITFGIALTVLDYVGGLKVSLSFGLAIVAILFAAVCYPLGNRQIMARSGDLNGLEKVYGILLCSYPTFIVTGLVSWYLSGAPTSGELSNTFIVALSSGVIATVMFFHATSMVKSDMHALAEVETTQAMEVVFSLLLSILFLHHALPSTLQLIGLVIMIGGIVGINMQR